MTLKKKEMTKMATLYELGAEFLRLTELLENDELTEEEGAELAQMFADNDDGLANKARGYRMVMADYAVKELGIKEEIERLKSLLTKAQNAQERLKDRIKSFLLATGRDEIDGVIGKFRLQNKPQSVVITAQDALPAEYLRIIPEKHEPDKTKIKEALKVGANVPGAEMSAPEKMLRVY